MFALSRLYPGQIIYTFIKTSDGLKLAKMKTVEIILREAYQEITFESTDRTKILEASEINTSQKTMVFLSKKEALSYLQAL